MKVPKKSILLLSGIPAAGKSSFGRYLARDHGFAHYDLECHPRGWPHPELKDVWDLSRPNFVVKLKALHPRTALDWGFPPHAVSRVHELLDARVRLVWFAANIAQARRLFEERGGIDIADFDIQIRAIQDADYPNTLRCVTVQGLTLAGKLRDPSEILHEVFAA
jgi:hypothetical protein